MKTTDICYHVIEEIIKMCSSGKQANMIFPPKSISLKEIREIIKDVYTILDKEPAVLNLKTKKSDKSDFVIVGDIHGDIDILVRIFSTQGYPSKTRYLFLGDYVDRGNYSCEVIIFLYAFKCLYPDNIYLIRGNHEFKEMASSYGFQNECLRRLSYDDGINFFNEITDTFKALPICCILNETTFCVHGGISALIENRNQLMTIEKVGNEYTSEDSIQVEFLWNDPDSYIKNPYERSPRGIGCLFNEEALNLFLKTMGFKRVIRGHQMADDGFQWAFGRDGKILTLFSSVNYCGAFNEAGVACFSGECDDDDFALNTFKPKARNSIRFLIPEEILLNMKPICPLNNIPVWITC